MKPRSIGIIAGGGGPIGSTAILQKCIQECQSKYGSRHSCEYPCITFFSFPYTEIFLSERHPTNAPGRELSYCITQLKNLGMDIIVIPCFTMCSYLTFRGYGVQLIEIGSVLQSYLSHKKILKPLMLCSERVRKSGYCDSLFNCCYPEESIQEEVTKLHEAAMAGKKVDIRPLLKKLPHPHIISAATALNAQLACDPQSTRWINPNRLLAEYVVRQSFEGVSNFCEKQRSTHAQGIHLELSSARNLIE